MIDRRAFLGGLLGLAAGREAARAAPWPGAADLARCDPKVVGVPRRRSLIAAGLHPVAAERVLVLDEAALRGFGRLHPGLRRRFRAEAARWPADPPLSRAKEDVCVGLMDRLTAHYRRPELFARWSRALWGRERLGSTGIGHGLGLLHDFQALDTDVETTNGVVDWWLVLVPGGVDWQAIDDRPVHFLVGPVMERRQPGTYLRVMEGISRGLRPHCTADGFDPATWSARLAGLPAADAARAFNLSVARGLAAGRRRLTALVSGYRRSAGGG